MLFELYLNFSIVWIHFQEKTENLLKSSLFKVECNYLAVQREKRIHMEPCLNSKISKANKQLFK